MISKKYADHDHQKDSLGSPGSESTVSPEMVRNQVERVLAHPLFQHSKRSSGLLKFIVSHTLEGKHESLKERNIGIEVFGRSASFDATLGSAVRVAAMEVRRRLALYYSEPEHKHELRIDLPTHSYVTEFTLPEERKEEPTDQQLPARSRRLNLHILIPSATFLLLLSLWGGYRWFSGAPAIDRFWSPMLNYPGPIPISISSLSEQSSGGQSPAPWSDLFQAGLAHFGYLPQQILITSRRDVAAAIAVASFLGHRGKTTTLQVAQNTTLEEMKRQPVIILGSLGNVWAVRLGANLRYQIQQNANSSQTWIVDEKRQDSRIWSVDRAESYNKDRREYALITRALDRSTGQWWIGVAGLTGLGTAVAQQMIMDPKLMTALSKQLPRDWDHKNLQVVLEINIVKESPGTPQVAATYSW